LLGVSDRDLKSQSGWATKLKRVPGFEPGLPMYSLTAFAHSDRDPSPGKN